MQWWSEGISQTSEWKNILKHHHIEGRGYCYMFYVNENSFPNIETTNLTFNTKQTFAKSKCLLCFLKAEHYKHFNFCLIMYVLQLNVVQIGKVSYKQPVISSWLLVLRKVSHQQQATCHQEKLVTSMHMEKAKKIRINFANVEAISW